MASIGERVATHLADWCEQRIGIERFAEMITAYYQLLIDSGIDEEFARLLVLQYQGALLDQIGKLARRDDRNSIKGDDEGITDDANNNSDDSL